MVWARSFHDVNIEVARVKNRAENIMLTKQLSRMNHERAQAMTLINKRQKKVANMYLKLGTKSKATGVIINQEAPEVIMYETHTPGFCYRCNGEQKSASNTVSNNVTIEYSSLHNLVFTDDVLDIEKILVLHLISVHKCASLTPVRDFKLATMYKENSPTARLLEKSRRLGFVVNKTMVDLLPFYTIEIKETPECKNTSSSVDILNVSNKLAHRILFNENLRKLISTVVAVLHSSNFTKFRQLIQLAHDPDEIRATLFKQNILDFMEYLSEQPIVNSCENFVLTPPFKLKTRDLNINRVSETLHHLIKNLRGNVLQLPKREYNRFKEKSKGDFEVIIDTPVKRRCLDPMGSSDNNARFPKPTIVLSPSRESYIDDDDVEKFLNERRKSSRGLEITDFVSRNIQTAGKTRKIEYDVEDDLPSHTSSTSGSKRSSLGARSRRSSSTTKSFMIAKHGDKDLVENRDNSDNASVIKDVLNNASTSPKVSIQNASEIVQSRGNENNAISLENKVGKSRRDSFGTGYGKYHIKMTTCKACMEKWRQPLPVPKTPRVKRSTLLPDLVSQPFKTDSKHRINMLINKEMFVLESYDRRFSSNNTTNKHLSNKEPTTDSYDNIININPMHLAKIEQEIREKETHKKLEKFLYEPIQ